MRTASRVARAAVVASALAIGLALPAGADDEPVPLRLSLADAEERVLARSEEIRLAREQVTRSESQIAQVRAGAFPQVTGSMGYDRTIRSIFDLEVEPPPGAPPNGIGDLFGDLPFGQSNTWSLGIQINQPLYTGGRVSTGLDIAERVRRTSRHGVSESESEIVRDVRQAYLQALYSDSLVEIAAQSHELADEQVRLVESFEARGTASELDVLQARVERDNIEPQLVQAQNAARLAELQLKRLLNIAIARPLELTSGLPDDDLDVIIDRDEVVRAALRRPVVLSARERVRVQEESIELARTGRRPTVSAFANFSWQAFPDQIIPTSLPGTSEWREDWIVGLQASIPIFDGFRAKGEIDEARSQWRSSVLEERQLRQGITMEAEATITELEASRAQIAARRSTVVEAERVFELAELRYETGMARLIELSNARLLLQQARVNEVEARVNFLSSLAAVEYITGGELGLFGER